MAISEIPSKYQEPDTLPRPRNIWELLGFTQKGVNEPRSNDFHEYQGEENTRQLVKFLQTGEEIPQKSQEDDPS